MKIGPMIKAKGSSLSIEFFPPKDPAGDERLFRNIAVLAELKPDFVSVTYGAGGGTQKNTFEIIRRIKQETGLEPMPHITCVEQSDEELTAILKQYKSIGVENILALRGDPPEVDGKPAPVEDYTCHADHLVKLAVALGGFSIGVAGYPEVHAEAPDADTDIKYTKQKVDAGADLIMTQMFFDNRYYYEFEERARRFGITVPILPGIMPITDKERIKTFCVKCGATLPMNLLERLEKAAETNDVKKAGIDIATEQCADLLAHGVKHLHFYSMNQSESVVQIMKNLNL